MLRSSFCAIRFYLDVSECWADLKRLAFLQNPDIFLHNMWNRIWRANTMFKHHNYFHVKLSLLRRALLQLALPFVWTSIYRGKSSPGDPLHNPLMQEAMAGVVSMLTVEGIQHPLHRKFYTSVSPEQRKKLFKSSAGIIHEDLFEKLADWAARYTQERFVYHKKDLKAPQFFARKMGEYSIRNIYLHYLVKLIRVIVRKGGLQFAGEAVEKLGWLLSKIGLFHKNPVTSSTQALARRLVDLELIKEGEEVKEVLVYPAAACPGAFARAVRSVITKQKIGPVLAKEPRFIASLNAMNGLSFYDLMERLATNFMTLQEMSARVVLIKNAVTQADWKKILNQFLNEAVAEIFFDRRHFICRSLTEGILGRMSGPLLKVMYNAVLPPEQPSSI